LPQSRIIYKLLQEAVLIPVFLKQSKLNKYIYKDLSGKPLLFHGAFCKINVPLVPLFHQDSVNENILLVA
jgi:hypothetical protein